MSKRRNREGAPNLPQETLERARRQAAIARGEMTPEPELMPESVIEPTPRPAASTPARTMSAHERRNLATVRSADRRARGNRLAGTRVRQTELDADTVNDLLAHPTIVVTEAELKAQYSFVVADLRNMFLLAGALMILLVVLATVLPR